MARSAASCLCISIYKFPRRIFLFRLVCSYEIPTRYSHILQYPPVHLVSRSITLSCLLYIMLLIPPMTMSHFHNNVDPYLHGFFHSIDQGIHFWDSIFHCIIPHWHRISWQLYLIVDIHSNTIVPSLSSFVFCFPVSTHATPSWIPIFDMEALF